MNEKISEKLKLLPDDPGVYVMQDKDGAVIYVGKARVLKNRVRQYFHNNVKTAKVAAMVASVDNFYYIITKTEIDALALENNLIKKYKPRYNILLKDDKTYSYVKVNVKEEYPTVCVTRRILKDGNRYFGPFMGGIRASDIAEVVSLAYGIRTCRTAIGKTGKKPCLNYHLHRCPAPCALLISKEEYAQSVQKALRFLDGDYAEVEEILAEKMRIAADNEDFERAIEYKERIEMLSKLKLKRITAINQCINADVIAYASNQIYSAFNVLVTRNGVMQGGENFALEEASASDADALTSFIVQYYSRCSVPDEIITGADAEVELLEAFFAKNCGKSVKVLSPQRGIKRRLYEMAVKNAEEHLTRAVEKINHKNDMTVNACARLQSLLGLKRYPKRMECYDISNISGVDKVGSMVVFTDGDADRDSYRRFKIKTVEGANDFASLQEVLERRLLKLGTPEEEKFPKPDLIVIDGGKGQLSAVREIFVRLGITDVELISLAKKEEEIFTLDREESVKIDHRDYALKMMQRLRDEAHRFAITYFRNIHSKNSLQSLLTEIEGVGEKKRKLLVAHFGTIDRIRNATVEELTAVEGIGEFLAKKIREYFEEQI